MVFLAPSIRRYFLHLVNNILKPAIEGVDCVKNRVEHLMNSVTGLNCADVCKCMTGESGYCYDLNKGYYPAMVEWFIMMDTDVCAKEWTFYLSSLSQALLMGLNCAGDQYNRLPSHHLLQMETDLHLLMLLRGKYEE